ncbi:MAG TPA: YraN family protein [Myxococcaceae bacterium]|nr:YraN family protein [Myxococcaceae bacterium]
MAETERRQRGDRAEEVAVRYLQERGYRVVARNFHCAYGELDVVAEKDDLLCVVEVRMRTSAAWGDPAQTVMSSKQRRIVKATLHYLARRRMQDVAVRFDVISVLGRGDGAAVEHIPGAFDAGF